MSGATTGGVRILLRAEGLFVFLAALIAYSKFGLGWTTFALYFFAPDLAFLGYLAGARIGGLMYNATHAYVGAVSVLAAGAIAGIPVLVAAGLIWCAHIGMDRALGYGLKYESGFRYTHLGLIGRAKSEA
jgi:multisubunit Na+/H+ antiporter MnhB subunit